MAKLNYNRLTKTANGLIQKFGKNATLTVKALVEVEDTDPTTDQVPGEYDPVSGSFVGSSSSGQQVAGNQPSTDYEVWVAVLPMEAYGPAVRFSEETTLKASNMVVMTSETSDGAALPPVKPHDTLVWERNADGTPKDVYTIIESIPIVPADKVVVYELGVVRA